MRIRRRGRRVTTDDTVAVGRAVHARVQQVRVHKVLRVRDRIRARPGLAVGRLLGGHSPRRNNTVVRRRCVRLTPPRLIKTTRILARRTVAPGPATITVRSGTAPRQPGSVTACGIGSRSFIEDATL